MNDPFDPFDPFSPVPQKKSESGEKRWYDQSFVKKIIESFEKVPPYKRDSIANKIIETVESVFKNEINRKVNSNKDMVLGMYKEFEKRRWYDKNPTVLKAIKSVCSLVDQRRDLQKTAVNGVIDALGEYYIREEPKIEIRKATPATPAPEPVVETEPVAEEPKPEPAKKRDSNVMVSGEKLFIKRDKPKQKPKL